MKHFTKYPSNYIGAASETSGAAMRRKKKEAEQRGREGSELLATDGEWELWTPKNFAGSMYLAKLYSDEKARWDTAYEGGQYYWDAYNDRGPLYIFVNKNTGEKYQSHPASNSWFYDIYDHPKGKQAFIDFINEHPAFAEFFDVDDDVEACGDINASTNICASSDGDKEFIVETPEWEVWKPLTWEGSIELARVGGSKARWATAYEGNDHYWNAYTKRGPLYIFINKNDPSQKRQLHIETNSWYDENDRSLGMPAFDKFCEESPEVAEYFCDYLGADCSACNDIEASTEITARIKSNFDAIRNALGEDEWYYVEGYVLDPDTKYSLEEILFDDKCWEDYCQWKKEKFGKKANVSSATRIMVKKIMAATGIYADTAEDFDYAYANRRNTAPADAPEDYWRIGTSDPAGVEQLLNDIGCWYRFEDNGDILIDGCGIDPLDESGIDWWYIW